MILPVDAKKAWLEHPAFATGPPPKLWKNPELETAAEAMYEGLVSTQASPVRGTDVKMLAHSPSSSSQIERHRKLHHQLVCPTVSSCLEVKSEEAAGLIQFWPKEGAVCLSPSSDREG